MGTNANGAHKTKSPHAANGILILIFVCNIFQYCKLSEFYIKHKERMATKKRRYELQRVRRLSDIVSSNQVSGSGREIIGDVRLYLFPQETIAAALQPSCRVASNARTHRGFRRAQSRINALSTFYSKSTKTLVSCSLS